MQNDAGRAFTDMYGEAKSLLSAIEEIERVALVQRFDDAPLCLRLLTPHQSNTHEYAITPLDAFRGDETYVTVSYAWGHSQSTLGLQIPGYRIRDLSKPSEPPRLPRCPSIIFHRAAQYARAKGYEYLWIDQECIHQDDVADRERHLQVMHRIYSASAVTIALLSVHVPSILVMKDFVTWTLNHTQPRETRERLPTGVLADWLSTMTGDRWFTRTWTMQEKLCSRRLEYLIPIPSSNLSLSISTYGNLIFGNDLAISVEQAVSNFDMTTSPEPGLLNSYQLLGRWLQPSIHTPDDLVRNIEFALHEMGPRNNSVVSDRLAILANVCDLRFALNTTVLDSPAFSYRTCLLVPIFASVWPDAAERRGKYRRWAASEMGETSEVASPDEILDEFIHRPRIGMDMRWIHYDFSAKDE